MRNRSEHTLRIYKHHSVSGVFLRHLPQSLSTQQQVISSKMLSITLITACLLSAYTSASPLHRRDGPIRSLMVQERQLPESVAVDQWPPAPNVRVDGLDKTIEIPTHIQPIDGKIEITIDEKKHSLLKRDDDDEDPEQGKFTFSTVPFQRSLGLIDDVDTVIVHSFYDNLREENAHIPELDYTTDDRMNGLAREVLVEQPDIDDMETQMFSS